MFYLLLLSYFKEVKLGFLFDLRTLLCRWSFLCDEPWLPSDEVGPRMDFLEWSSNTSPHIWPTHWPFTASVQIWLSHTCNLKLVHKGIIIVSFFAYILSQLNYLGNLSKFKDLMRFNIFRHKLNAEALRESVIFAKRITGTEAVRLKIVDATVAESDLISKSKTVGFEALGSNVIQRVDLHNMKKDLIPGSSVQRKSNL